MSQQKEELIHLKRCLQKEVMVSARKFSWVKTVYKSIRHRERRFLFWWRIASYLYTSKNKKIRSLAKYINRRLMQKYGTEIHLDAKIGTGFFIVHYCGIVIAPHVIAGKNLRIHQNTTIGKNGKKLEDVDIYINIGDNVTIGANSCIIGNHLTIGSNVYVGAMSFINKDIPSNCTVYTIKTNNIIVKPVPHAA